MLEMREGFEPVVSPTPRHARWILAGVVLLVIVLGLLLLHFAPSADAAGSCGGG